MSRKAVKILSIEEVKRALLNRERVMLRDPRHGDIEYNRISAVVYRPHPRGDGVYVQVELEDACGRSVTVCNPKDVELIKEKAV